ncbi:MAG: hypothetical protein ACTSW1_05805 [Candidatus Hodarchaeales archaeon]
MSTKEKTEEILILFNELVSNLPDHISETVFEIVGDYEALLHELDSTLYRSYVMMQRQHHVPRALDDYRGFESFDSEEWHSTIEFLLAFHSITDYHFRDAVKRRRVERTNEFKTSLIEEKRQHMRDIENIQSVINKLEDPQWWRIIKKEEL